MPQTTTSTLDNLLSNYWVPKAVATLYRNTPLWELARKTPLPKGTGNIAYWNAFTRLAGASSTLAEGGSNAAVAISSRRVSATIAQYGRRADLTDLAEFMTTPDSREHTRELLTESAKETLERVCQMGIYKNNINRNVGRESTFLSSYASSVRSAFSSVTGTHSGDIQLQFPVTLATSTTRLSATSGSAPSLSSQLSVFSIRKAIRELRVQDAKPFSDGYYVGYAHPNALHSLMRDVTWKDWNQYQNSKETMYKGEVGSTMGVRWLSSTMCPRYAVAARSITACFIFGQESFGVTDIKGGLEFYAVTGPDSNNPFSTYSVFTYKVTAAATSLNPSAGRVLLVAERLNS